MKRMLLLTLATIFMAVGGSYADTNIDTLWTKFLYNYGTCLTTKFSPDGSKVAVGTENGNIFIYSTSSGSELASLVHPQGVHDLSFNVDGTLLASVGWEGTIRLWNMDEYILDTLLIEENIELNYDGGTRSVEFSADGRYLITLHTGPSIFYVFDATSFQEIRRENFDMSSRTKCKITPDSKYIVFNNQLEHISYIEVRNFETWEDTILDGFYEGSDRIINGIAISPNSKLIAAAGEDGTVRIWSLDSMKLVKIIRDKSTTSYSCLFTKDQKYLFAGSHDIASSIPSAYFQQISTSTLDVKNYIENRYFLVDGVLKSGEPEAFDIFNDYLVTASRWGVSLVDLSTYLNITQAAVNVYQLFPNPTNSIVTINFDEIFNEPITINLISLDGSINIVLFSDMLSTNSFTFSIAEYPQGAYFVRTQRNGNSSTYKIIKE